MSIDAPELADSGAWHVAPLRHRIEAMRLGRLWPGGRRDLEAVESWIAAVLSREDGLMGEVARHLTRSVGKRMRPILVMLGARLGSYDRERVVPVAAATELVHMATLVHDDVIDGAGTRRGQPTVNVVWNDRVAVLLGDYLFSRALTLAARYGGERVVDLLSAAVEEMCRGEMEQEEHRFDPDQTEEQYLVRIGQKTARLIADCCRAGGMMGEVPESFLTALGEYGYGLGMAFQIIDDVLDFTGNGDLLGKPVGSDLCEGVVTLPVIYALAEDRERNWIRELVAGRQPGQDDLVRLRNLLKAGGYLERAQDLAREFRRTALEALAGVPRSPTVRLLEYLADFVVERRF